MDDDTDKWITNMFQITNSRIIDVCNLIGFNKYKQRAGSFIWSVFNISNFIQIHGFVKTVQWFCERHPREFCFFIYFISILKILPEYIPDKDIWLFRFVSEFMSHLYKQIHYTESRSMTIGIIPDGNRRWGKLHSLNSRDGHFFGALRIIDCVRSSIFDKRINQLIIYVMSYDNIQKRSKNEQYSLIAILNEWLKEFNFLYKSDIISLRIYGEPSEQILPLLKGIPINTPHDDHTLLKVSLLIGYDGRREIIQSSGNPENLWIKDDPDGIIRSGGYSRASGFCTYQSSYSEWIYSDKLWPDISISKFNDFITHIEKTTHTQNYGR